MSAIKTDPKIVPAMGTTQRIDGHAVVLVQRGVNRYVRDLAANRFLAQVDILPLCAGKDAWMRRIRIECSVCGKIDEAGNMEGGGKDLCCPSCFEKIGEEIEEQELETYPFARFFNTGKTLRGYEQRIADASELRWPPGHVPEKFKVSGIEGMGDVVFTKLNTDIKDRWDYIWRETDDEAGGRKIQIQVYND